MSLHPSSGSRDNNSAGPLQGTPGREDAPGQPHFYFLFSFIFLSFPYILEYFFAAPAKTYLTADTEGLEWVQSQPATVACIAEPVHELRIKGPLDL